MGSPVFGGVINKETAPDHGESQYTVNGYIHKELSNDTEYAFDVYLTNISNPKTLEFMGERWRYEMSLKSYDIDTEHCHSFNTTHSNEVSLCPFTLDFENALSDWNEISRVVQGEYLMAITRTATSNKTPFESNYFMVNGLDGDNDWTDEKYHFLVYSGNGMDIELGGVSNGTVDVFSYRAYDMKLSTGHYTG